MAAAGVCLALNAAEYTVLPTQTHSYKRIPGIVLVQLEPGDHPRVPQTQREMNV